MFSVIVKEDSKIMANSRFVKNAVFYKDLLAFYEFYENIMSIPKKELPNYVIFPQGGYCLDGICLIAKNYASELGFETLNLSLEYLKTIYYTIAGFADEEGNVDKQILKNEYEEYKKASKNAAIEIKDEVKKSYKLFADSKVVYEKESDKYAKKLILEKTFNILYIFFLVFGFISAMVPLSFYFLGEITILKTSIIAGVCLTVGLALTFIFKKLESKLSVSSGDTAYGMQILKKNKDSNYLAYKTLKDKENKILSERYEYENKFYDELKKYGKTLTFAEILELAREYKLLSYNYRKDIEDLFISEQKEINETVDSINALKSSLNNSDIAEIYSQIKQKDWLYYNLQVRFNFLNKFISRAEKTKEWTVLVDEIEENPFDINIKKIAKEEIAYLKSEDGLFVASSLDKFLSTKFARNLKDFEIKNKSNYEDLKNLKVEYMKHFYNYDLVKDYNNLFYDRKIQDGITISEEIIENNKKIPSLVALKIKLLEDRIGFGNNNSTVIKQISSYINEEVKAYDSSMVVENQISEVISDEIEVEEYYNPLYELTACEAEIIDEHRIKYTVGDESFIGYTFADVTE